MQILNAPSLAVNAAPQLYPVARRYAHSYESPSERYHKTANDDGALLIPAIGRTAWAILECLRGHLNSQTGQCNPSLATIAAEVGAWPSTVTQNLKYLEEAGVIFKAGREIHHHRRGKVNVERVSSQYLLLAREAWTPERVTRKRAKPGASENRSTLVENLPMGCREIAQPVSAKSSTNKTKLKKKNPTTQTEHPARENRESEPRPVPAVAVEKLRPECPQPNECEHSNTPAAALLAQVLAVGVQARAARALVERFPDRIPPQLAWLPDREPRDRAATLVKSIREEWGPPAKYLQRQAAQDAQQQAQAARAAQEQARASEAQQRAATAQQADDEAARLDAEWEAMPPVERRQIENAARARLGVLGAAGRCGPALDAMRRNLLRDPSQIGQAPGALFQGPST